jgi:hypothetical protein
MGFQLGEEDCRRHPAPSGVHRDAGAYRLHVLTKPTPVSWLSLHSQFGAGFKKVRQFKPTMFDALSMALAVYPEAEVSVGQDGLTLFPSPPAIPKAEARRLGII